MKRRKTNRVTGPAERAKTYGSPQIPRYVACILSAFPSCIGYNQSTSVSSFQT